MLFRILLAGCLALGTGTSWSDTPENADGSGKLHYSANAVSGDSTLLRGINFNGVVFPLDTDDANDIDLTQFDGTVFYELQTGSTAFDLGVSLRYLDGVVQQTNVNYGRYALFDGIVPLLYGQIRVGLPWPAFYAAAQARRMDRGGDRLADANLLLGWLTPNGVGVEAGYRHYRLKLSNYDELDRLNIDLSGPYASVSVRF